MSAVLQTVEAQFEPFLAQRLDDVLAIEQVAYPHPWTRGNFLDSLHHGYQMQLLTAQPPSSHRRWPQCANSPLSRASAGL